MISFLFITNHFSTNNSRPKYLYTSCIATGPSVVADVPSVGFTYFPPYFAFVFSDSTVLLLLLVLLHNFNFRH